MIIVIFLGFLNQTKKIKTKNSLKSVLQTTSVFGDYKNSATMLVLSGKERGFQITLNSGRHTVDKHDMGQ